MWKNLSIVLVVATATGARAQDLELAERLHAQATEHVDQSELTDLVRAGRAREAFEAAFEDGDELFETRFNALDGVGANVGRGQRFTRTPRADLNAPGEWATHVPARATGPNAESCNACHNQPFDDGSGPASANVHRDPLHSGALGSFIQRNTPHLFGMGGVQRLAEEMTARLHEIRDRTGREACASGQPATRALFAKGIDFGRIRATPTGGTPCASFDTSGVVGLDPELVVRPFQWKGIMTTIREFNRDASHNELGMQAVEFVGDGVDGDADGVADEMTIGDQTALAVYLAAQPRPTTRLELARLRLIDPIPSSEVAAIRRGESAFRTAQCATCHTPRLEIEEPTFREPSAVPSFRDAVFPAGQDPVKVGVDPRVAVRFDLTRDQPDNQIRDARGRLQFHLGAFARDSRGRAIVELYGDLKRHDLGPGIAESIDEGGTGASVFLTENLWGVGSTPPYLHDGRATTLAEAIAAHGGDGAASRDAFLALSEASQRDVVAFLDNLVLFVIPDPEE